MPDDQSIQSLFDELRQLAAQNPRAARERFAVVLASHDDLIDGLLSKMGAPGEGRLRQLVANFARSSSDSSRFISHFQRWLENETDEFAKRSIIAALQTSIPVSTRAAGRKQLVAEDLVDMYRYVADRLRHELQNALLGPKTCLLQIRTLLQRLDAGLTRSELEAVVLQLRDEFHSLGRMAEFEPHDEYFEIRHIRLTDWIQTMNGEYARRYNRIELTIEGESEPSGYRVLASDYLLRLIFWNLWVNAHQAIGDPCHVRLEYQAKGEALSVVVIDNGKGFPSEMASIAFQDRYSKSGPHRGRGLLEVQDAVTRLHGQAELIEYRPGEYRVTLGFPRVQQ